MYPKNDNEFTDLTIDSVFLGSVKFSDGWSIGIPDDFTHDIKPGMSARQYGKGFGFSVRGLFIDGKRVWYRTEAEQDVWQDQQIYGKDAQDILDRWDSGRSVFSVEMGGFGPGYEQCIQITALEVLRICLEQKYEHANWDDPDLWEVDKKELEARIAETAAYRELGLSGAQYGAAMNLGLAIYRHGPGWIKRAAKDRSIQVSKHFPSLQTVQ